MLKVKSENINYLAKIVKITNLRAHPGADRLQLANIENQLVVTGLNSKVGDVVLYFPLESAINNEFLSFTNNFSDPELNSDKAKKGFFKNSRVRATKLRGIVSEGYIHPISDFNLWLKENGTKYEVTEKDVGQEFDTVGDITFVEKYVNRQQLIEADKQARIENRSKKKVKKESKILEGQYRVTADTENLKRNIHNVSPEDWITISYKMHGCAFSAGKVLCKKPLKWYEKLLKKFKVNIVDYHYDLVYASRRVIKNSYADKEAAHYYDMDVWGIVAEKYQNTIKNGITIGGEICGQLPNGKWIQKDYDYGLPPNNCDLFVYRIYYTGLNGEVYEFTTPQIVKYCQKMGLKTVPIFYYGKAKDLYKDLILGEHWHENFLERLKKDYTEKKCYICNNNVPEEGVCVVINDDNFMPYKLKSMAFLEKETKELDTGENNIDDDGQN